MSEARAASLRVFSAGAAKGLVQALADPFETETGVQVVATFDSAGATRAAFANGAGCDVVILPAVMQDELASQKLIDAGSIAALGGVQTGVAVARGDAAPALADADALRASLIGAPALYCPDTIRATAGIHFAGMLRTLGIYEKSISKVHAYPNGALAMAALAASDARGAIGCTQITEILYTTGVMLVAPLPPPFELSTIYAVAVSPNAALSARAFAERLASRETAPLRRAGGFVDCQH